MTGKLIFGGIGISKGDVPLKLIDKAKEADEIYLESYTSSVPGVDKSYLKKIFKKDVKLLKRSDLEEDCDVILERAKKKRIMILVPGDPMLFTTHQGILVEAKRFGIETEIIHATSIYSAAISESGLQASKFGKSVTLPFRFNESEYAGIYEDIMRNKEKGLHTLILLEITEKGYLSPKEAMERLIEVSKDGKINKDEEFLVLMRIGAKDRVIRYDAVEGLIKLNFRDPPFVLILPGKLHFVEEEYLNLKKKTKRFY